MKKNLFTLIIFLVYACGLYAQDTRTEKNAAIKTELNNYLATKNGQKHTPEIEKKIQAQLNIQEPGHPLTPAQKKEQYNKLVSFFWENQFWQTHPDYATYVSQRHVGNGANLCANGGFEFGNNAFSHFSSIFNPGGSNNCIFSNNIIFNPTIATTTVMDVPNQMQVVGAALDPFVPGLTQTHSGGRALRINSRLNDTGAHCGFVYQRQIDKAATTFVLDASTRTLSFWFAAVLENPNHTPEDGQNPFFMARVRNHTTGAILNICLDPTQNNLQNAGKDCSDPVLWQGWRCGVFDMTQWAIGTTVTLEFIAADCAQGGHYGYAYIDDICAGCNITGSYGNVTIATSDNCFKDGVTFNGTITLPVTTGATLQSLTVQLRQNGSTIATIPVTITGSTFTGTVPANLLVNGNGYDLVVIANFNVPGLGTVTTINEVNQGINNDFRATNDGCCDITDNSFFTIQTNCNNGVLTVTVTANDTDPANQWWGLYQTTTSIADGGVLVAQSGGSTTATFTITDYSKFYYIKHGIWDDCYDWRETRALVPLPKSDINFHFLDNNGKIKDTFCYGEPVKMYAYSLLTTTAYYIDVWRRPIDSTHNFDWYGGLGWTNGAPGLIDLSAAFAGLGTPVYFEPGYEYQIKLAVSNPQLCIGWSEVLRNFKVICCEDYLDGDFCVDPVTESNFYTLKIKNYNVYSNIGAVHEWYVLSSPNSNAGPYTQVTSSTSSLPQFNLYTNANYNLYYTVVHKLKTKCGEICMVKTQYQTGRRGDATAAPEASGCGAKKIDCQWIDSIWNPCKVPTGLFGSCARNVLVWNPVAGASGYIVEISFNDPNCCRSSYQPTGARYEVTGSSLPLWSINTPKYDCFRWRVKTKCGDKESDWSAWQCFYCRDGEDVLGHNGGEEPGKRLAAENVIAGNVLQPQVSPNPNNGEMMLSMQAPADLVLSIDVINAQGVRVTSIARNTYRGGLFNYKLRLGTAVGKGVYTVVFNTNYGTSRKKVIVN